MRWSAQWQDVISLVAGAWLMMTHMIGVTAVSQPSSIAAYVTGASIVVMAGAAIESGEEVYDWINAALGTWLLAAPFVLGLTEYQTATLQFILVGATVAAASVLSGLRQRPTEALPR